MEQTQTTPRTFLWVNRGQQADLERPGFGKLMSHVSKVHRKWLKDERVLRLNRKEHNTHPHSSSSLSGQQESYERVFTIGGVTNDRSTPSGIRINGARKTTVINNPPYVDQHGEPPGNQRTGTGDELQCHDYRTSRSSQNVSDPDPGTYLPTLRAFKGNSDPFEAAATKLGPLDTSALASAHKFIVFQTQNATLQNLQRVQLGDDTNSHITLSSTIYSPAETHAVIAAGFLTQASSSPLAEQLKLRSLFHRTKAMTLLREQLQQDVSLAERTTLINLLLSLDCASGNYAAAKMHLSALGKLCQQDDKICQALKCVLVSCDFWLSATLLSGLILDHGAYDPGRVSEQPWKTHPKVQAAIGRNVLFQEVEVLNQFDTELFSRYLDIKECTLIDNILTSTQPFSYADEARTWLTRRAPALSFTCFETFFELVGSASMHAAEGSELGRTCATICQLKAAVVLAIILGPSLPWIIDPGALDYSTHLARMDSLLEQACVLQKDSSITIRLVYLWTNFVHAIYMDVCAGRGFCLYSGETLLRVQEMFMDMGWGDLDAKRTALARVANTGGPTEEFLIAVHEDQVRLREEPLFEIERWREILCEYATRKATAWERPSREGAVIREEDS